VSKWQNRNSRFNFLLVLFVILVFCTIGLFSFIRRAEVGEGNINLSGGEKAELKQLIFEFEGHAQDRDVESLMSLFYSSGNSI